MTRPPPRVNRAHHPDESGRCPNCRPSTYILLRFWAAVLGISAVFVVALSLLVEALR